MRENCSRGHLKRTFLNIYIFIAIALDETSILVAVQFSMQNIYESCQRPQITFFVY